MQVCTAGRFQRAGSGCGSVGTYNLYYKWIHVYTHVLYKCYTSVMQVRRPVQVCIAGRFQRAGSGGGIQVYESKEIYKCIHKCFTSVYTSAIHVCTQFHVQVYT